MGGTCRSNRRSRPLGVQSKNLDAEFLRRRWRSPTKAICHLRCGFGCEVALQLAQIPLELPNYGFQPLPDRRSYRVAVIAIYPVRWVQRLSPGSFIAPQQGWATSPAMTGRQRTDVDNPRAEHERGRFDKGDLTTVRFTWPEFLAGNRLFRPGQLPGFLTVMR